jgi:hypothetical protein
MSPAVVATALDSFTREVGRLFDSMIDSMIDSMGGTIDSATARTPFTPALPLARRPRCAPSMFDCLCPAKGAPGEASHALRLRLMMSAYRKAKTLGILENKLLAHTAMRRLGIPVLDVTYGAMAFTDLGEWKRYSRTEMYAALRATKLGPERPFVVKPASDGTNYGLLVMNPARWKKENWTEALVARHIERFLFKERSSWGQWYEQRGVIVQEMYTDGAPPALAWPNGMAEFNVLGQLGRAVHVVRAGIRPVAACLTRLRVACVSMLLVFHWWVAHCSCSIGAWRAGPEDRAASRCRSA